jgi:hypothetical protein
MPRLREPPSGVVELGEQPGYSGSLVCELGNQQQQPVSLLIRHGSECPPEGLAPARRSATIPLGRGRPPSPLCADALASARHPSARHRRARPWLVLASARLPDTDRGDAAAHRAWHARNLRAPPGPRPAAEPACPLRPHVPLLNQLHQNLHRLQIVQRGLVEDGLEVLAAQGGLEDVEVVGAQLAQAGGQGRGRG